MSAATQRSMNIALPPDLQEYVRDLVAAGRYASVSEAVRDAVRQHKEFENMRVLARADLARQVEIGWADFDAGRVSDFDPQEIKNAGRARLAKAS